MNMLNFAAEISYDKKMTGRQAVCPYSMEVDPYEMPSLRR